MLSRLTLAAVALSSLGAGAAPAQSAASRNSASSLCGRLTAGYPPSVTILGYFVPAVMVPGDFGRFKRFVRERQGQIPDNTKLPPTLAARKQVPESGKDGHWIEVFFDASNGCRRP